MRIRMRMYKLNYENTFHYYLPLWYSQPSLRCRAQPGLINPELLCVTSIFSAHWMTIAIKATIVDKRNSCFPYEHMYGIKIFKPHNDKKELKQVTTLVLPMAEVMSSVKALPSAGVLSTTGAVSSAETLPSAGALPSTEVMSSIGALLMAGTLPSVGVSSLMGALSSAEVLTFV